MSTKYWKPAPWQYVPLHVPTATTWLAAPAAGAVSSVKSHVCPAASSQMQAPPSKAQPGDPTAAPARRSTLAADVRANIAHERLKVYMLSMLWRQVISLLPTLGSLAFGAYETLRLRPCERSSRAHRLRGIRAPCPVRTYSRARRQSLSFAVE